jgi:hypothetical protein
LAKKQKTSPLKMQNLRFGSVEEFLDFLPEEELKLVELLRKIIFNCAPGITEKLSYNVPFYKMHKGIFFIWPASVLWGNKQTYKGVRFGFQQGFLMADDTGYLEKGERKQVYWHDYPTIKEVDIELLKAYVFEALLIDEQLHKKV